MSFAGSLSFPFQPYMIFLCDFVITSAIIAYYNYISSPDSKTFAYEVYNYGGNNLDDYEQLLFEMLIKPALLKQIKKDKPKLNELNKRIENINLSNAHTNRGENN